MEHLQDKILAYYQEGMPFSDCADVESHVLEKFAEHAAFLREHVAWCQALPEDIFMENVAAYRINNERIEDCRKWFFGMVWPQIQDMEVREAIGAVNMWCAGQVTYHPASARTANAVTAYKSGWGRCGEESVFTVTVLRSVGLAARQVYAPLWSHCDDNHAWVEVWCEGEWRYLGACEPEPVLDRGWFTYAASRAMLVHARCFGEPKGRQEFISRRGCASFLNVTGRYADTVQMTLEILEEEGKPVRNGQASLEVLNYGDYGRIAVLATDGEGKCQIRLGKGEIQVSCSIRGEYYSCRFLADREGERTVRLTRPQTGKALEYRFLAPFGRQVEEAAPDPAWEEKLQQAKQRREERLGSYFEEKRAAAFPEAEEILKKAGGNFAQVAAFLETDNNPYRTAMLNALEEKDWYDVRADILEEHLQEAMPFAGQYPENIFIQFLLNPRVQNEELSAYRKGIKECLGADKEKFLENPAHIWSGICSRLPEAEGRDYQTLPITPLGAIKMQLINEESRGLLFVAICRSLGIPARMNPVWGYPEYYREGMFHPAEEERETKTNLLLAFQENRDWKYASTWSLARWNGKEWKALRLEGESVRENRLNLVVGRGQYRLLTMVRESDGNQLVRELFFHITGQEEMQAEVKQHAMAAGMEGKKIPLPVLIGKTQAGEENLREYCQGQRGVCIWLEEGREPSEHILAELLESSDALGALSGRIFLLKREPMKKGGALEKVRNVFPDIHIWDAAEWEVSAHVAEKMGVEKKYPLAVAWDEEGNGLYATAGYNVGAVRLLLERMRTEWA